MADELQPGKKGAKEARRIVRRQIRKAIEPLQQAHRPLSDTAVHEARKRLKNARAVLRLLRPALDGDTYRRENTALRDSGRPLTTVRDTKILGEALKDLLEHFAGKVDLRRLRKAQAALQEEHKAARQSVLAQGDVAGSLVETLEAIRQRARDWDISSGGWSVLSAGLKRVYRQGRDAMAAACKDPAVEKLHEWRKQSKYLWHGLQVFEPMWPPVIGELADQAHCLAEHLGDDHDLAVLRDKLTQEPVKFGGSDIVKKLTALIDRGRQELEKEAFALGRRLYAEKPKEFVGRLKRYWRAWRRES